MRLSPSTRTITGFAVASFSTALLTGSLVLTGLAGAHADTDFACRVTAGATTVSELGNTTATWTATGNCTDITVNLVAVTTSGEKVLSTDNLGVDGLATFTYGTLPAGTNYEFQIQGKSAETSTPTILSTITGPAS